MQQLLNPSNYNTSMYGSNNQTQTGSSTGHTNTVGTTQPLPPGFTGTPGEAYTRQVRPEELASHQLTGLLSRNNPYMQANEDAAYRRANSRGIMDSSMGLQAGRAAAIEAGLPIAMADAGAYGTAAGQNQQYLNQMEMERQGNETSRYNADQGFNASSYATTMGLANNREQRAYEGEQAGLQRSFQDYMRSQGFGEQMIRDTMQQQFGQQNAALSAGLGMMGQNQAFNYSLVNNAMQNPTLPSPQQLSGLSGWATGNLSQQLQQLFQFALGGGQP